MPRESEHVEITYVWQRRRFYNLKFWIEPVWDIAKVEDDKINFLSKPHLKNVNFSKIIITHAILLRRSEVHPSWHQITQSPVGLSELLGKIDMPFEVTQYKHTLVATKYYEELVRWGTAQQLFLDQ